MNREASPRAFHHVSGRLSLRPPQAESLSRLVRALEAAPELRAKERDVAAILISPPADFAPLASLSSEVGEGKNTRKRHVDAQTPDLFGDSAQGGAHD